MNDYANYYELANAITSMCISDYTKEMRKYYHTGKYKEKEIYDCERYLLESVIMKLMYSEDERINILEKLKERCKQGSYYSYTKKRWNTF